MFDYIVIGAGLSGLATAWRLKQKGEENVLIVEARNRIGGRTHTETVEVAGENINVDMGASYIMGVDSNPLVQYLKTKAKMKFDALVLDEENAQFYDSGPVSLETARKIEHPRMGPDESLQEVFDKWKSKLSLEEAVWVEQFMNADVVSDTATSPRNLSAWYFDAGEDLKGPSQFLRQGFSQIYNYFAQGMNIQLETVVSKINYASNQDCAVSVTTSKGVYKAKYAVVVTVPIGVLKAGVIEFIPDLPSKKKRAIERIGSGNLNKLYMAFSHKFWNRSVQVFANMSASCTKIASFWNACSIYPKHNMLLAFYGGDFAHEIEPSSCDQKEAIFKQILVDCFGEFESEIIWWTTSAWETDPFARGSYSYLSPGAKPADIETLAAPIEEKLFFAGEATSKAYAATAHGAWQSGCDVVDNNY